MTNSYENTLVLSDLLDDLVTFSSQVDLCDECSGDRELRFIVNRAKALRRTQIGRQREEIRRNLHRRASSLLKSLRRIAANQDPASSRVLPIASLKNGPRAEDFWIQYSRVTRRQEVISTISNKKDDAGVVLNNRIFHEFTNRALIDFSDQAILFIERHRLRPS